MEIWKDVIGYEGIYQVSNFGNVQRVNYRGLNYPKLLNPFGDKGGYLKVALSKDGNVKKRRVHQLICESFFNHKPDGYKIVVDHINNIKTDNRVENLQLTTVRHNTSKDKKGSSKYTGVCWNKSALKWMAYIQINGKSKTLGLFSNELDAHYSYQNSLKQIDVGIQKKE